MSDNAFWALIICALIASCTADDAIKAYRDVNKPTASQVAP
jgi:hypothetical protein